MSLPDGRRRVQRSKAGNDSAAKAAVQIVSQSSRLPSGKTEAGTKQPGFLLDGNDLLFLSNRLTCTR